MATTPVSVPISPTIAAPAAAAAAPQKLIGSVKVEPPTVQPGQPAFIQVFDPAGKLISDPAISVVIQEAPAAQRYCQFALPGSYNLLVAAAKGGARETAMATVNVAGTALAFRPSITQPVVTEIPILQVTGTMGKPYTANFTLGNPPSVNRILAAEAKKATVAKPVVAAIAAVAPAAAARVAAVPAAAAVAPAAAIQPVLDPLGAELAKSVATLPAEKVIQIAPVTTKTPAGTMIGSAMLAPIGGLKTPPTATSYQWDFGDGTKLTTQSPSVSHDFFPAIQAGDLTRAFDVTCTIAHDNITVKRTLVLHSAYGLCRRFGVIVPHTTGPVYAAFQQVAFTGSVIVNNLEASAITINSMACVPLSDDTSVVPPAPNFTKMQVPVTIAAKSASALGVYVTPSQLKLAGAKVNSFIVYYSGTQSGGSPVPVHFSYVFRISLGDQWILDGQLPAAGAPGNWDHAVALAAVTSLVTKAGTGVSKAGGQTIDPATHTIGIALSANPTALSTQIQVNSAVQAGMTAIALKTGVLTQKGPVARVAMPPGTAPKPAPAPRMLTYDPLSPPAVAPGNECYPDDIPDADAATATAQQLVCQLTSQTETVTVPCQFQNALQGDVILSPAPVGSGDLIAAMFSALTPPQHHGHSGIMTANFFEITHCTASVDRIAANVNKDGVGIPTGLKPEMVQYAWPGSLTQSIDDATGNVYLLDPGGDKYSFQSFNVDAQGEQFAVIPPLVIKPLPEDEGAARPLLRKAADTARSKGAKYQPGGTFDNPAKMLQKGGCYYSFYCYTDPQMSAGFTDAAGADAGWAQGLSPAVCSSFVWLSLKDNNIPLVSPNQYEQISDFPATAVAGGVQVGAQTLDGLLFYPAAERLAGGNALYQMFMNQALGQEGGFGTLFGGVVNSAVAGPIANQLLNDFASGNPNLQTSAWQNPGDANAVSPDNIIWWNPPNYGYAEPVQYLPRHTEQYTVSKWNKVITWGTVKGKVTFNGAPVPNAHVWVYLPGGDAYTAADGTFTLNHIGIGKYALNAQAVITTNGVSANYTNGLGGQQVSLTAASPNIVQNIDLKGLPANFRKADITYSVSCDHGDDNPFNTHGVQNAGPYTHLNAMDVDPGQPTDSCQYTYDYNGGGYFHINYSFTVALLDDLSLEVTLIGTMYDDSSPPNFQTQYSPSPFNVPAGETWSGWTKMEQDGTGYHNGPATFTFSLSNNQQTG